VGPLADRARAAPFVAITGGRAAHARAQRSTPRDQTSPLARARWSRRGPGVRVQAEHRCVHGTWTRGIRAAASACPVRTGAADDAGGIRRRDGGTCHAADAVEPRPALGG